MKEFLTFISELNDFQLRAIGQDKEIVKVSQDLLSDMELGVVSGKKAKNIKEIKKILEEIQKRNKNPRHLQVIHQSWETDKVHQFNKINKELPHSEHIGNSYLQLVLFLVNFPEPIGLSKEELKVCGWREEHLSQLEEYRNKLLPHIEEDFLIENMFEFYKEKINSNNFVIDIIQQNLSIYKSIRSLGNEQGLGVFVSNFVDDSLRVIRQGKHDNITEKEKTDRLNWLIDNNDYIELDLIQRKKIPYEDTSAGVFVYHCLENKNIKKVDFMVTSAGLMLQHLFQKTSKVKHWEDSDVSHQEIWHGFLIVITIGNLFYNKKNHLPYEMFKIS